MGGDLKPITKRDLKEAKKLHWDLCGRNSRKRLLELRERLYLLHDKIYDSPYPRPYNFDIDESIRLGRFECFDAMKEGDDYFDRYYYMDAAFLWMKALNFITEIFKATLEGETPSDGFINKTMYDNWGQKHKQIEAQREKEYEENYQKMLKR